MCCNNPRSTQNSAFSVSFLVLNCPFVHPVGFYELCWNPPGTVAPEHWLHS